MNALDKINEVAAEYLCREPRIPENLELHLHPDMYFEVLENFRKYMSYNPQYRGGIERMNLYGCDFELRRNRHMINGEVIIKPIDEYLRIPVQHVMEQRHTTFDFREKVLNLQNYKHQFFFKIEDYPNSAIDPIKAVEEKMRYQKDRLTAKGIRYKILISEYHLIISVLSDDMYALIFADGVNAKTIEQAGNEARANFKEWLDRYCLNLELEEALKDSNKIAHSVMMKNIEWQDFSVRDDLVDAVAYAVTALRNKNKQDAEDK